MARIEGVDPHQTSFLMRQVFKKVRKMLGRDLTPQKNLLHEFRACSGSMRSGNGCWDRNRRFPIGSRWS